MLLGQLLRRSFPGGLRRMPRLIPEQVRFRSSQRGRRPGRTLAFEGGQAVLVLLAQVRLGGFEAACFFAQAHEALVARPVSDLVVGVVALRLLGFLFKRVFAEAATRRSRFAAGRDVAGL